MISYSQGGFKFNYRVAGIVVHDERVLIHQSELDDFWAMPGGRVELREPVHAALKREMKEELGVKVDIEHLPWIVEQFFQYQNQHVHELCFYYLLSFSDKCHLLHQDEFSGSDVSSDGKILQLFFRWHKLNELENIALYPAFLRKALKNIPPQTEFLSFSDLLE